MTQLSKTKEETIFFEEWHHDHGGRFAENGPWVILKITDISNGYAFFEGRINLPDGREESVSGSAPLGRLSLEERLSGSGGGLVPVLSRMARKELLQMVKKSGGGTFAL